MGWYAQVPRDVLGPLFDSVEALFEAVHALVDPVKATFDAVQATFEAGHALFKPVHALVKPVHALFKPVHALVEPVEAVFEPVQALIESVEPFNLLLKEVEDLGLEEGVLAQHGLDVADIALEAGQSSIEGVLLRRHLLSVAEHATGAGR